MKYILTLVLILILFIILIYMTTWQIDGAHSSVELKVQHLGISWIKGLIFGAAGTVNFEPGDLNTVSFEATVDTSTIDSGNDMRDGHLKSPDFLDSEKFPKATLKSLNVENVSNDTINMKAELTIKGVTKEVMLEVKSLGTATKMNQDQTTTEVVAFTASTKINRNDFGITWNIPLPGGKVSIGEEVMLQIEVEATK